MSEYASKRLGSPIQTVFVVGASGATGRHVVQQIAASNANVRILVRDRSKLPPSLTSHERVTVYEGAILDIAPDKLRSFVDGCDAVVSCLGQLDAGWYFRRASPPLLRGHETAVRSYTG